MVSKAEIAKDIAQTTVESGAKHAGRVAVLIAGTVSGVAKDVAGIVFKPSISGGAERVGDIVTRIAGCVGDVAKEVGTFATDVFEIAEAGSKAHADAKAQAETEAAAEAGAEAVEPAAEAGTPHDQDAADSSHHAD